MIRLHVLGAFEVSADPPGGAPLGITQPKRLALLLYLALSHPQGLHARERLLALLWPDADDASSRHSLRNALHALRQALGERAIVTRGDSYVGLDRDAFQCDALDLRAHLAEGRLDDALALWKGDLAPGFHVSGARDFEDWLDGYRTELRRDVRAAAWKRTDELVGKGQAEVDALRRALQLDAGNEPGARRLIRLLDAAGDRGGALRVYRELADYFARELETQPSAETSALVAQFRSQQATRRPVALTPAPPALGPAVDASSLPVQPDMRGKRRRTAFGAAIAASMLATLAMATRTPSTPREDTVPSPHDPALAASAEAEHAALRLPARYRGDTSAYSSYLRGLTLRFQFQFSASRDTFASLVDRNPLYVPGLYGLAHAFVFTTLNDLTDAEETWPRIDALARRALALDSTAASAWLALAAEDMFYQPNLPRAGERIVRARLLDSLEPDGAGMHSVWFRFHGQMDSAVAAAKLAHQLDPMSRFFTRLVARQLYFAHRFEESRTVYTRLLREDPGWKRGYADLGDVYLAMGRPRDAVEWYRRDALARGDSARAAALATGSTDAEARRLLAADARRTITRLDGLARAGERVPASSYALAFGRLGDTVPALQWLDSILTQHDSYVHHVRLDPVFDFLRADPRYQGWLTRAGLPPLAEGPTSPDSLKLKYVCGNTFEVVNKGHSSTYFTTVNKGTVYLYHQGTLIDKKQNGDTPTCSPPADSARPPLPNTGFTFPADTMVVVQAVGNPATQFFRNIFRIRFDDTTSGVTVQDFLGTRHGEIIGGLPNTGAYIVRFPDPGSSYNAFHSLASSLNSAVGVDYAAPMEQRSGSSLPIRVSE